MWAQAQRNVYNQQSISPHRLNASSSNSDSHGHSPRRKTSTSEMTGIEMKPLASMLPGSMPPPRVVPERAHPDARIFAVPGMNDPFGAPIQNRTRKTWRSSDEDQSMPDYAESVSGRSRDSTGLREMEGMSLEEYIGQRELQEAIRRSLGTYNSGTAAPANTRQSSTANTPETVGHRQAASRKTSRAGASKPESTPQPDQRSISGTSGNQRAASDSIVSSRPNSTVKGKKEGKDNSPGLAGDRHMSNIELLHNKSLSPGNNEGQGARASTTIAGDSLRLNLANFASESKRKRSLTKPSSERKEVTVGEANTPGPERKVSKTSQGTFRGDAPEVVEGGVALKDQLIAEFENPIIEDEVD